MAVPNKRKKARQAGTRAGRQGGSQGGREGGREERKEEVTLMNKLLIEEFWTIFCRFFVASFQRVFRWLLPGKASSCNMLKTA